MPKDATHQFTATALVPFGREPGSAPADSADEGLRDYDFGADIGPVRSILVLKLDHFGDFIIAEPALRALRNAFPGARIRLICGRWNVAVAEASGVADEVRGYNFFPERALDWQGRAAEDLAAFDAAAAGRFDLAIDLRVDEDTRALLGRVDARLRCGIGHSRDFPLLDIALPPERRLHALPTPVAAAATSGFLAPAQCSAGLALRGPLLRGGRFGELVANGPITGPLPRVRGNAFQLIVELALRGFLPGPWGCSITIEVRRADGELVARQNWGRTTLHRLMLRRPVLTLRDIDFDIDHHLVIRAEGRALAGWLRFTGAHLLADTAAAPRPQPVRARLPAVQLHVGEMLGLLVALIHTRTLPLYPPPLATPAVPGRVVIAPFSNSSVRDWPVAHYARLIRLLLADPAREVVLIGTPGQAAAGARLAELAGGGRLDNRIGLTRWDELATLLRSADLVVCNNSGIAHLAASLGAPVLGLYSGSHQPPEWGPRGPRAHVLTYMVRCSPCGFENIADCPYEHRCMTLLTPDAVFARVSALLADGEKERKQASGAF